jgi:hypothetical protein
MGYRPDKQQMAQLLHCDDIAFIPIIAWPRFQLGRTCCNARVRALVGSTRSIYRPSTRRWGSPFSRAHSCLICASSPAPPMQ